MKKKEKYVWQYFAERNGELTFITWERGNNFRELKANAKTWFHDFNNYRQVVKLAASGKILFDTGKINQNKY